MSNSNYDTANVSNNFPSLTDALSNASSSTSSGLVGDSASTSSSPFFGWYSWKMWIFIFIILSILGINVFLYLQRGTQYITDIIAYFASLVGTTAVNTTKEVIDVSNTGIKGGSDIITGTIDNSLDTVQNAASQVKGAITGNTTTQNAGSVNYTTVKQEKHDYNLDSALNNASSNIPENTEWSHPTYTSDDSYSTIQANKSTSKNGWCYIGEDRGIRSCLKVGENDNCLSGDIFPSSEICINPNLRK